jgi:antagonist of KipI
LTLTILRPGMLTTIQDLGRWGRQASGVPVAGPMDPYSHRLANRLVGNHASAAALEVTLIGPELEADDDVMCAVAGAMFDLTMDGQSVPMHSPFTLRAGRRLRFGPRSAGVRATFAVRGGLDVDRVFGSRATSLISRMGPLGGRALAAGDVLPVGDAPATAAPPSHAWNLTRGLPLPLPDGGARLRIVPGPHDHRFTRQAYDTLFGSRYAVTPSSNRMGYRLEGAPLVHAESADILSDATPLGSIQVPASGQPILLMADRQTTGGYPKIGTLATADIPLAGQLGPGDWIDFEPCTREVAIDALKVRYARLEALGR